MKSKTLTVTIDAPAQRVYAYASDPARLPHWAPGFCRSIERRDGVWVVESPDGPVEFAFAPANDFGVLDHTVRLPSGLEVLNPMRVVPHGAGSVLIFSLSQPEGMSDEQFAADAALVRSDLRRLKRLLESAP